MYTIELDQGDYYEQRGPVDWGRCNEHRATLFSTRDEASREISDRKLHSFGGRVRKERLAV